MNNERMYYFTAKRFIIAAVALVLGISSVSCSGSKTDSNDTGNTAVTTAVSQEQQISTEITAEDTVSDDKFDVSKLVYDFTGLDSQEYIEIFAGAHYTLKASIQQNGIELSQVMYVDSENENILFSYKNPAYTMSNFITSDSMYYISQGKYFSIDVNGYQDHLFDSYAIYKNCGYIGSGTKELGGVSYKYDEFYDLDQDHSFMILMNSSNGLEGILDAGMFTRISGLSTDFDKNVFDVLDGLTEISQEEFGALMSELMNAEVSDDVENSSDDKE